VNARRNSRGTSLLFLGNIAILSDDIMKKASIKLYRKQYLLTEDNITKIANIQAQEGKSAAEVVRDAIVAYVPTDLKHNSVMSDIFSILAHNLTAAVKDTQTTNEKVESIIENFSRPIKPERYQ
jgi:urease gamma subunit